MNYITEYQNYINFTIILCLFIWLKRDILDLINSMLSESGKISSKRVISISSTIVLLYLFIHHWSSFPKENELSSNIIIALVTIVLTSSAIASIPQILELVNIFKGNTITKKVDTETPKTNPTESINDGLNQP